MAEVDIIDLWNKGKKKGLSAEDVNVEEMVSKKSRTPLYWIKVILWIEFWLNAVSLPFFVVFSEEHPILYGIVMPVFVVIYLFYYQFLIRKIKSFDYSVDVKSGLRKLYNYLNFFFLHYKVIIWLSMTFGIISGYYTVSKEKPIEDPVLFFSIMIVMMGLLGLLFTWLINLIYGRKIKRLRGIVKELEAD